MAYYPQGSSSYFSRRAGALVGILALHALVIWAFISGFANNGVRYVQTILQTTVIQTEKPKDLPPPPPPVDLKERPPVQVVAPDINITVPVEAPPPIAVVTTQAAPPPPPVIHVAPPPGTQMSPTFRPDVQDYYPETSRRNNEEGRTTVKICTDVKGKITNVEVANSSGHPLLDDAAVKVGKAYRFKPATQEGHAVESCATLPVRFELHAGGAGPG